MTQDATFKKLRQKPFSELQHAIVIAHKELYDSGLDIDEEFAIHKIIMKLCFDYGYTLEDYRAACEKRSVEIQQLVRTRFARNRGKSDDNQ